MPIKYTFYRIDAKDPGFSFNGFSVCVKFRAGTYSNADEIIKAAVAAGVIYENDAKDFKISVEDITNDPYELDHWKEEAHKV